MLVSLHLWPRRKYITNLVFANQDNEDAIILYQEEK
jgi:hypothetical protein